MKGGSINCNLSLSVQQYLDIMTLRVTHPGTNIPCNFLSVGNDDLNENVFLFFGNVFSVIR